MPKTASYSSGTHLIGSGSKNQYDGAFFFQVSTTSWGRKRSVFMFFLKIFVDFVTHYSMNSLFTEIVHRHRHRQTQTQTRHRDHQNHHQDYQNDWQGHQGTPWWSWESFW